MNLAELEAEVLLLGIWRNIAELEEALNLDELKAIVGAMREREHRANKFAAALKGIDLDKGSEDENKERFEAVQRRVAAKLTGKSQEQMELDELAFDFEVEE